MFNKFIESEIDRIDTFLVIATIFLVFCLIGIVRSYFLGLKDSPRELFLVLLVKFFEYGAFGLGMLTFALYLNHDVGLTDVGAGTYVGVWMVVISGLIMVVGAVCDVIGIRQTLLIGCAGLILGRSALPIFEDTILVSLLGFLPLAFGVAISGPVLLVALKRYTTESGAALAFGLYYTLLNLGFAAGGWIFDHFRGVYGDYSLVATLPIAGEISIYQLLIATALALTIPQILVILLMRENIEMTGRGIRILEKKVGRVKPVFSKMGTKIAETARETYRLLSMVVRERRFWIFISALAIVTFIRIVSLHFLLTFPTYGIRLFGDGAQVGNLYAVLNPIVIVFLTPLFSILTSRASSYVMLLIGCSISALSIWIATVPAEIFTPLMNTSFSLIIFDRWLDIPSSSWDPFYLSIVMFIFLFSLGEAIWAPRLMQFTAEIAPPEKEGSYIALSYLPLFLGQFLAGPMSGLLLATYLPAGSSEGYPLHYMVWVWVGLVGLLTPIGMIIFRKNFQRVEHGV